VESRHPLRSIREQMDLDGLRDPETHVIAMMNSAIGGRVGA
jgi:hypothetical protein